MSVDEDLRLLDAWRGGDEESGNDLVRRHFRTVARFLRPRVDADALADLTQRTFLGCVQSKTRVPEGLPFHVYLLGIARRILAQHYRERSKSHRNDGGTSQLHAPYLSPSGGVAAKEEQRLLLRALRRLALDLQLVIELFYWEQLSTEEIGHVLDVPRGTVKSRLSRAKTALRSEIADVAESTRLAESTVGDLEHWARSLRRYLERDEP